MTTTVFFRLPIISFIVTFCLLFALFILKINDLSQPLYMMSYNYSPDFMRIIGVGLFTMLVMSICLHQIRIYTVNIRHGVFVIVLAAFTVFVNYWIELFFIEYFANLFNFMQAEEYHSFQFWLPIISRSFMLIISFCLISGITKLVKSMLHWQDDVYFNDLNLDEVVGKIQLIYFILLYLAICFIFQRYLYVSLYLFWGGSGLSEYHNFSFYLAAVVTISMLAIFISKAAFRYHQICFGVIFKTVSLIILSQLISSIIISYAMIYAVQTYFVVTAPAGDFNFTHYLTLLSAMVNSIFAVSILTCIVTYFAGRFWVKRYLIIRKSSLKTVN